MPKQPSIKQNLKYDALPDFRNLGVALRILLLINGAALPIALLRSADWGEFWGRLLHELAIVEPLLLASMLVLYALNSALGRLSRWPGYFSVIAIVVLVTLAMLELGGDLYRPRYERDLFRLMRYPVIAAAAAMLLLGYFRMRALALSPAIHEARLQALRARIRPHFLFNCINTVLGILRSAPGRAETALEDMADLFRMAMAPDVDLVPLVKEMELARRYLELEKLRMGDRLGVDWEVDEAILDAKVPPLVLQPLLENAVYHGIEPLAEGGRIQIKIGLRGKDLGLEIYNPRREQARRHAGNKLALSNIRERLSLLFDIEAEYGVEVGPDFYRVRIVMPYLKKELVDEHG